MNFFKKMKMRAMLRNCDYVLAGTVIKQQYYDENKDSQINRIIDRYMANPGFDEALKLINHNELMVYYFTESCHGGLYVRKKESGQQDASLQDASQLDHTHSSLRDEAALSDEAAASLATDSFTSDTIEIKHLRDDLRAFTGEQEAEDQFSEDHVTTELEAGMQHTNLHNNVKEDITLDEQPEDLSAASERIWKEHFGDELGSKLGNELREQSSATDRFEAERFEAERFEADRFEADRFDTDRIEVESIAEEPVEEEPVTQQTLFDLEFDTTVSQEELKQLFKSDPEPQPELEPIPEPELEPVRGPEPIHVPEPQPEPVTDEPEPEPIRVPKPQPEPVTDPDPQPEPQPEPQRESNSEFTYAEHEEIVRFVEEPRVTEPKWFESEPEPVTEPMPPANNTITKRSYPNVVQTLMLDLHTMDKELEKFRRQLATATGSNEAQLKAWIRSLEKAIEEFAAAIDFLENK